MSSKSVHYILTFILVALVSFSCSKSENDPKPDTDYSGTLTLEYSRTFPEFRAIVTISIDIYKTGEILFSSPDQAHYSGIDEKQIENARIKIEESGSVTVTSLSGKWKLSGGEKKVEFNASTLIDGTEKIWAWDKDIGWIKLSDIPFTINDPVDTPILFPVDNAVMGMGSSFDATAVTPYSSVTYRWTLVLLPVVL